MDGSMLVSYVTFCGLDKRVGSFSGSGEDRGPSYSTDLPKPLNWILTWADLGCHWVNWLDCGDYLIPF